MPERHANRRNIKPITTRIIISISTSLGIRELYISLGVIFIRALLRDLILVRLGSRYFYISIRIRLEILRGKLLYKIL